MAQRRSTKIGAVPAGAARSSVCMLSVSGIGADWIVCPPSHPRLPRYVLGAGERCARDLEPLSKRAWPDPLQDCDRIDLDHQAGKRKPGDSDCGRGRWPRRVDELVPHARGVANPADVSEVQRHLDDVIERRAGVLEHRSEVLKSEARLA